VNGKNISDRWVYAALAIVAISWALLAVFFGATDLEISRSIADTDSALGIFGRDYGQIPGVAVFASALVMLAGSRIADAGRQRITAYAGIIIGAALIAFPASYYEWNSPTIGAGFLLGIPLMLLFTRGMDWKACRNISRAILILGLVNPLLFVMLFKYLWGRVRFYQLSEDYSDYTPWYVPNGPSEGDYSFPSGHTAAAWMLLPLLIFVKDRRWNDPVRIATTLGVVSWGLLIPYTRVLVGDHYASDVLFPTGVAFVVTLLLYKKVYLQ
jgi:membrane-associated phospholipid phosphatase